MKAELLEAVLPAVIRNADRDSLVGLLHLFKNVFENENGIKIEILCNKHEFTVALRKIMGQFPDEFQETLQLYLDRFTSEQE